MSTERDTVLVGAGNVASHIAEALSNRLIAISSRTIANAETLAQAVGVPCACALENVATLKPRFIIFSVADKALSAVATSVGHIENDPIAVHTSGTMPMETLATVSKNYGVVYPLQTFTKGVYVDLHRVPFFTEGANNEVLSAADEIAHRLSDTVHHADASSRRVLHVAGVFTSNFSVALLEIVEELLSRENYPLSTVQPLLEATIAKAFSEGPHKAMTGPARRGDNAVIAKHLDMLDGIDKEIYDTLTRYILNKYRQ